MRMPVPCGVGHLERDELRSRIESVQADVEASVSVSVTI
jgi:hypothetical protein